MLKTCYLMLLITSTAITSCSLFSSEDVVIDEWRPTIYVGSSQEQAVLRHNDDGKLGDVLCTDKRFDDMFCMSSDDIEKIFKSCIKKEE